MAIDTANLKWYQCATWAEGDSHGGSIDTGSEITTDTDQNIFDDVSDAERVAGDTEYRKIFFRNENADDYNSVKAWIETQTPATNSAVSVVLAGTKSTTSTPAQCTGTATFTNGSPTVTTTGSLAGELRPGEMIYNATDDAEGDAVAIASISGTTITLASNYGGTSGSGKDIYVAGADQFTFVAPDSKAHADVLVGPTLAQNEYVGIWIKRVISAAGSGYTDDYFEIKAENS